jgi:hypothetical protein
MTSNIHRSSIRRLGVLLAAAGIALAACGSTPSGSGTPSTAPSGAATGGAGQVLPVTTNPISNASTDQRLKIDSVLVENNVDAAGKVVDDHLEIALRNTGSTTLSNFELFYTYTDPTANTTESYYAALTGFTVPAGGTRVAHFDNTGAAGHFPVNKYSLYYTSANALDVTVVVSAEGAAVQTATVKKDAGGAENPSE